MLHVRSTMIMLAVTCATGLRRGPVLSRIRLILGIADVGTDKPACRASTASWRPRIDGTPVSWGNGWNGRSVLAPLAAPAALRRGRELHPASCHPVQCCAAEAELVDCSVARRAKGGYRIIGPWRL